MGPSHSRRKMVDAVFLASFFLMSVAIVPSGFAETNAGPPWTFTDTSYLTLDHTSGPPGTIVDVQVNIPYYLGATCVPDRTCDSNSWKDLTYLRYAIVWDLYSGDANRPQSWYVIGEGEINSNGILWGESTIPYDAAPGSHTISVVRQGGYNSWRYGDYWTASFWVTGAQQTRYAASAQPTLYSGGPDYGGSGYNETPGFEFFAALGAVIGVVAWKKMRYRELR
jgi:hypothetical protein